MSDYKPPYLTGRIRATLKTLLVGRPMITVQVEVKTDAYETSDIDNFGFPDARKFPMRIEWRDARQEDFAVVAAAIAKANQP